MQLKKSDKCIPVFLENRIALRIAHCACGMAILLLHKITVENTCTLYVVLYEVHVRAIFT